MDYEKIDLKNINNIIKNINTISSLKCFIFKCYSTISKEEYENLIKKILQLKIKTIKFGINIFHHYKNQIVCNNKYNDFELKDLYENADLKYFENIKIYKIINK